MDIKNSAVTAKMAIHSLLALLENENVDISSVKFKVGSDGNGYESPEFELEKLVSLAIDGLVEIEKGKAAPEGFVLVSMNRLTNVVNGIEALFEEDTTLALGELLPIQQDLKAMIEAQEQSHD